ncbi:anhydro-N-acetylmuramic acid kinase [Mucilaginibacter sp. PPCGB 2223]|uniref:anhydro-N-acetylmuramic acid kinase n=1 Tax=Mucilaginibacter sp. PPCGB 2223 TaxID=1886027 RepID=UPI0008258B57|nr:anhydro-N-acetylmuramic acid kinase [Mucilaginibacter sp. PPCGB 2223]OCX51128.1 anhydro-N-acetylmuramic acid kinase [Mucilaginibacter sp. PPCGB 2223]
MQHLNSNLTKLVEIASKTERLGIGLMSGTSLDGLDVALCRFAGNGLKTQIYLHEFATLPYSTEFKNAIREVFSKQTVNLEKLTLLNAYIGNFHGQLVLDCLEKWGIDPLDVDYVASHGQTIYHAPKRLHLNADYPNATLQIGDGDHLAVKTGILTISDFRQKHLAAGGEGAPLALYGDVLLGTKAGEDRILLNMGGIANLTYLPADSDPAKIMCTDIGPGNTLIDAACKKYFNRDFDENSKIAFSGEVNEVLLNELLSHSFFKESFPKTTGPELFNLGYVERAQQLSGTQNITPADIVATLSTLTAKVIVSVIRDNYPGKNLKLFVSGGGYRNPFIMKQLQQGLRDVSISSTAGLGIDPDAKEAILFALLGNETLCGEPIAIGTNPATLMGKISFPV